MKGLLLGLVIATVVTGAIIGGALGSQLSQARQLAVPASSGQPSQVSNSSFCNVASNQTSLENYQVPDITTVTSLPHKCDPTTLFVNRRKDTFALSCGQDFNEGYAAEGGRLVNIVGILAYSLLDCLDACSMINEKNKEVGHPSILRCRSVAFAWTMGHYAPAQGGNCYLKNGTLPSDVTPMLVSDIISAKLTTRV